MIEWTSIKKGNPQERGYYLARNRYGYRGIAFWNGKEWVSISRSWLPGDKKMKRNQKVIQWSLIKDQKR